MTAWRDILLGICSKNQKAQGITEYALILAFMVAVAVALGLPGGSPIEDAVRGKFAYVTELLQSWLANL